MGRPKAKGKRKSRKTPKNVDEEVEYLGYVEPDVNRQTETPVAEPQEAHAEDVNHETEIPVPEPQEEHRSAEKHNEDQQCDIEVDEEAQPTCKRKRGPTRLRDISKAPETRIKVSFNFAGAPYGPGSVKLSSYVGALVREHVPVTLDNWKKLSEETKTLLWKSIQARFELDEEYQKVAVFKQMENLWRSSKSRLVTKIKNTENNFKRNLLRPKNVSISEWRKFVKTKTSKAFQIVSDSYKARRSKQIPFTCSRKGMVRLGEEMKSNSEDPSQVTRLHIWMKSRTRKDGTPINTDAAEKLQKAAELIDSGNPSSANQDEDALVKLLGPDNPGRLRAMGINMSKTKLACFQVKHKSFIDMQEQQVHLQAKVNALEAELAVVKKQRQDNEIEENSIVRSVNKKSQPKCLLIDWDDGGGVVAEGRIISTDPDEIVNDSPLGPSDVKVLVEIATVSDAFLWRPASDIHTIEAAVGNMIAWPAYNCVKVADEFVPEEITPLGSVTNSLNKCKLLDLIDENIVVGEGRWHTQDPKALVNGLPLGPKAVKICVDVVQESKRFIWRPRYEMKFLEDCLHSFVAWPLKKVIFENPPDGSPRQSPSQNTAATHKSSGSGAVAAGIQTTKDSTSGIKSISAKGNSRSTKSPTAKSSPTNPLNEGHQAITEKQKCKLMDITGKKQVVAEGTVHSTDPNQRVDNAPLGPNAATVWVNTVLVPDAALWMRSDEMESMKDAHGSRIGWPIDKLVIF